MASAKPTQPPAFDASAHEKVLYDEVRKDDGSGYQVFQDKALALWKRWVGGEGEFDGKGLRDVVQTNAVYLDSVKGDLDDFRENNGVAHNSFNSRLAALESQIQNPPFPD